MSVREADLGSLTYIAEGAFAKVYKVEGYTMPGDRAPLAYKRFTQAYDQQARSAAATVAFRDGLSSRERDDLDRFSTWPRALVEDRPGNVSGLLMALIPQELFSRYLDENGALGSRPLLMEYLISTAEQRALAQVDLDDVPLTERLILLAQLVYVIARLHRHGWVFGDLSFRNVAFGVNPPRLMLLDCDGAASLTDDRRSQASTPFWQPPECPHAGDRQDDVSDVYKLGLAILRCLTPGKGAATTTSVERLAGELDDEGAGLLARALSRDRAVRPAARELYAYLKRTVTRRTAPPRVVRMELLTPYRVRGQDVRVEWEVEDADELEVRVGQAAPVTLDPAAHPGGYVFRPAESGRLVVVARNRYAEVTVDLGDLELYELPPFDASMARLPRVPAPRLEPFRPPVAAAALRGRPRITVGSEVVTMPSLGVFRFVEGLRPVDPVPMPPHPLRGLIAAVGRDRASALQEAVTRLHGTVAAGVARRSAGGTGTGQGTGTGGGS
ncbi:hypothetical protein Skr01_23960 [Sphaerisporangium krabiense]|uniref:Serine/threonine protein kinase n=1 Tax=Sphaerisporangium krabiense TaxID=763782 RepID=A0A7W8Z6A1_9ACTN|nr:hypothetical protein [Sphaerisporangium krabiense]MBB5628142.1 serine/threonine protein kinase [Sphaerisporangium krabiense]GII62311.1 hypothetical protein Skr01_23960 [Sphaerisporangium krabiense]